MTPLLWVSFGFAAALFLFLVIAFFAAKDLTISQWQILRVISAFCSGISGGLFSGEALFKLDGQISTGFNMGVSGSAGFALFFTIWFTFGRIASKPKGISLSIPSGWTFEQTASELARSEGKTIEFLGFDSAEKLARLNERVLVADSGVQILGALGSCSTTDIRPYDVRLDGVTYQLRII